MRKFLERLRMEALSLGGAYSWEHRTHRAPPTWRLYLLVIVDYVRSRLCSHAWVDLDVGDPECGPMPDLQCRKCGCCG